MKIYEILSHTLYQRGTLLRHPTAAKWVFLDSLGITGIVNLYKADADLQVWSLAHPARVYWHRPIADGVRLDPKPLLTLASEVERHIRSDRGRVLVMCHAGRNRSGLVSALIIRQLLRCSGAGALAHVRSRRPHAVANTVFAAYLGSLESLDVQNI